MAQLRTRMIRCWNLQGRRNSEAAFRRRRCERWCSGWLPRCYPRSLFGVNTRRARSRSALTGRVTRGCSVGNRDRHGGDEAGSPLSRRVDDRFGALSRRALRDRRELIGSKCRRSGSAAARGGAPIHALTDWAASPPSGSRSTGIRAGSSSDDGRQSAGWACRVWSRLSGGATSTTSATAGTGKPTRQVAAIADLATRSLGASSSATPAKLTEPRTTDQLRSRHGRSEGAG